MLNYNKEPELNLLDAVSIYSDCHVSRCESGETE